jgi:hypothetical protein
LHLNKKRITITRVNIQTLIGKKSLPEIRKSEARASERYWLEMVVFLQIPMSLQKNYYCYAC